MVKKGMRNTASTFAAEANVIPPNTVAMDDGFFTAWWRKAYGILNTEVAWPEHIPQPQEPNFRERLRQGIGIHIPDFPQMPEELSASDSLVQGQSSTSSDTDTNLQIEPTPDAPTDNSSRPIEPNTCDEGTSNQSRNLQTEATSNAPTDDSSCPKPKTSDAGTSNQSRNLQTEATPNAPTDDSLCPMARTSDAGS
ncbi:Y' element ATP-dependent helicase YJL225C-like [Nicotiana tomentosiformis]|uniref:Y' element ATP-dependent helicase YJL225C-like n=1 Tax=Nicotiana tomentosiformis TaxID=4098 RepID=UPI00051AEF43|nr:uncharacterized protein LOC117280235 [Nicotiana tomentosiformis]